MANPPESETFRSIATISSKRWPNFKERVWNLQTRLPTEVLDSLPISKCQAISTCSYINRGTRKHSQHSHSGNSGNSTQRETGRSIPAGLLRIAERLLLIDLRKADSRFTCTNNANGQLNKSGRVSPPGNVVRFVSALPRIHATASGKQIPFMQQWGIASAARSRCDACI